MKIRSLVIKEKTIFPEDIDPKRGLTTNFPVENIFKTQQKTQLETFKQELQFARLIKDISELVKKNKIELEKIFFK